MTPQEKQWQRVKDYDHSIIKTHWGDGTSLRGVDSSEGPEKSGSSFLEETLIYK